MRPRRCSGKRKEASSMDKYGYKRDEDDPNVKTAVDKRVCPKCGAELSGNPPVCPKCGSEPFEERDAEKERD